MNDCTGVLIRISAALGARRSADLPDLFAAAAACDPVQVEEALLQSYLFVGYPAALNALALWREHDAGPASVVADDPTAWRARGEAVCARVYAGQYERLRANIARLHPEVEAWMLTEGYGKVLGRAGLPLVVRELCIVGLLVPQDASAQLHAHLRGALHVGAAVAELQEAVHLAAAYAEPGRAAAAQELWEAVRERWLAVAGESGERDVR